MKKILRFLAGILVFAMMSSLCSCAIKTAAQKSEEASLREADKFREVCDLLQGLIGTNFTDATTRLETYFGFEFDLVNYSDCTYYNDEDGYYDYCFEKPARISDAEFSQIRIRCTIEDETVFYVGFISDSGPAGKLDEDYGKIVTLSTDILGQPKSVRNPLKDDDDVAFTEYGLGDRIVISAGRYISSEYNSLWFDINDWKTAEELGVV